MYPNEELTLLAACKAVVRERIIMRRMQCAEAAARAAAPIAWLDRGIASLGRLSPIISVASVPLGLIARRSPGRRGRVLGALFRWTPVVLGALRGLTAPNGSSYRS